MRVSRKTILLVFTVVIVTAAGFTVYWASIPHLPWLFKGAYAVYSGKTTVLFIPVEFTFRLEVLDYNSTHVKMLTYQRIDGFASIENSTTAWQPLIKTTGSAPPSRTYESDLYVEGIGLRHCMVYVYEGYNNVSTVYVDKGINWPLKFQYNYTYSFLWSDVPLFLDLRMTDTNIPGLKK